MKGTIVAADPSMRFLALFSLSVLFSTTVYCQEGLNHICGFAEKEFWKLQQVQYSPVELQTLDNYTHGFYGGINEYLRNGPFGSSCSRCDIDAQHDIPILDLIVAQSKPLPCDIIVYRGIKLTKSQIQSFNKIFLDKAFMSASYDESEALVYSKPTHEQIRSGLQAVLFKIHLRRGMKVVPINSVYLVDHFIDDYSFEKEFLIPREVPFNIVKRREDRGLYLFELSPIN